MSTPPQSPAARTLRRGTFQELPLGAVEPRGWLLRQLRLHADGQSGQLEEIWPDVGPCSAWLGGDGEDWERGPYYVDGLVPLAYLLKDESLLAKSRRWIEWTLGSQRPDGQFGPPSNLDWWPRMVMLKALTQYQEATGDPRVVPFMRRYFAYLREELPRIPLSEWGRMRGADNVLSVYWLHERTGEASLLELAALLLEQTMDWDSYLADLPARSYVRTFDHTTHVVNVAMGLKAPAVRYLLDGRESHLQVIHNGFEDLLRYHGQIEGIFSGDEWLAGLDPSQGVELCAVVELMFSLEHLVRIYGEGAFADRLELLAFNALAATISADMHAHQYDQQPNQVLCTVASRNWTSNSNTSNIFGLVPHFGCCTANMHQGWPKFARSLWMATDDGGLAAVAYAPSTMETRLPSGALVRIEELTDYPFGETIGLTVQLSGGAAAFPLHLRIPGWCEAPEIRLNGVALEQPPGPGGFAILERTWQGGDRVELILPMRPRGLERPEGAMGIALGPLILALQVGEAWTRIPDSVGLGDWEVRPTSPWNYALAASPEHEPEGYQLERTAVGERPFSGTDPAIKVRTLGYRVPGWTLVRNSAGPLPKDPADEGEHPEPITLVPYGCARLRIAEFPPHHRAD